MVPVHSDAALAPTVANEDSHPDTDKHPEKQVSRIMSPEQVQQHDQHVQKWQARDNAAQKQREMLENQKKAVDVVLWYQDDVEPVSLNVYAIDTFPLLNIIQSTTHFDKTQQSLLKRLKLEDNQTILWYRFDRNDWVTDSLTRDFPIVKGQPLLLRKDGVSALHLPGFGRYKEGSADTGVLRRVSRRVSAKSSKRVYDEMEYAKDVIDGFHAHDENMRLHKRARTCSERNSSMNEGHDMDYALRACQEWEKVEARKAECGRDMRHCQAPLSNHFVENSTPQLLSSLIQLPSSPDLYASVRNSVAEFDRQPLKTSSSRLGPSAPPSKNSRNGSIMLVTLSYPYMGRLTNGPRLVQSSINQEFPVPMLPPLPPRPNFPELLPPFPASIVRS
ncbi:hypothetical protein VKT23_004777 [Stygiomarasmius scandens]|uniref:Uncharacterized protein n=1 Tax=Marasmiellus scandens TaxID=2682957 RepID=A0ABR1JTS0_9AGAR